MDACPSSVEKMLLFAEKIGDKKLSDADVSLLALASEFRRDKKDFTVVSDDYSVQNICRHLKIRFEGSVQGKIRNARSWK